MFPEINPRTIAKGSIAALCLYAVMAVGAAAQNAPAAASKGYRAEDLIEESIFGFTSITDTGDAGSIGAGIESDGRFGKRDGRYFAFGNKYYTGYSFAENWVVNVALFDTYHRIRGVSVQPVNLSRGQFDGSSIEIAHRLVSRSDSNPFAVTLSFEPRWARIDGGSGLRAQSRTAEMKLFIDAVVVPGVLFWGFNANFAPSQQQDWSNFGRWVTSTGANVSTALSVAVGPRAAIGIEARQHMQFQGFGLGRMTGRATFVGPTGMFRITEKLSVNAVFLSQIAGHARGVSGVRLDLDNFERRIYRVALSASF